MALGTGQAIDMARRGLCHRRAVRATSWPKRSSWPALRQAPGGHVQRPRAHRPQGRPGGQGNDIVTGLKIATTNAPFVSARRQAAPAPGRAALLEDDRHRCQQRAPATEGTVAAWARRWGISLQRRLCFSRRGTWLNFQNRGRPLAVLVEVINACCNSRRHVGPTAPNTRR